MSLVKTSQPSYERLKRKTGQKNQSIKHLQTRWENMGGKSKDYRYHWWQTFYPKLRKEKEKPEVVERGGVCLIKDLVDEGLGQNKVLYSSSGVELPIINYHTGSSTLPVPGRQICGYSPTSGSRTTLTRIPPCCFFLVASLSALCSSFC